MASSPDCTQVIKENWALETGGFAPGGAAIVPGLAMPMPFAGKGVPSCGMGVGEGSCDS